MPWLLPGLFRDCLECQGFVTVPWGGTCPALPALIQGLLEFCPRALGDRGSARSDSQNSTGFIGKTFPRLIAGECGISVPLGFSPGFTGWTRVCSTEWQLLHGDTAGIPRLLMTGHCRLSRECSSAAPALLGREQSSPIP